MTFEESVLGRLVREGFIAYDADTDPHIYEWWMRYHYDNPFR